MNRLSRMITLAALCALAWSLAGMGASHAAAAKPTRTQPQAATKPTAPPPQVEAKPARNQSQMDTTIVYVDKYGVYVPNVIFYWDEGMSKQKMESLKKLAEKMRNRKVSITYSATDDLTKDKRPLLVDMVASRDDVRPVHTEPAQVEQTAEAPPDTVEEDEEEPQAKHLWNEAMKRDETARAPSEQQTSEPPVALTPRVEDPRPPASTSSSITREELAALVRRILSLNERKDVSAALSYYADQVNYYDRGNVDRDYIRRDMGYYFRNWDTIRSTLDGDVVMIVTGEPDSRIVKFVSAFTVQNAKRTASGKTENVWKVRKINNDLRIVDVKQKVVRSGTQ